MFNAYSEKLLCSPSVFCIFFSTFTSCTVEHDMQQTMQEHLSIFQSKITLATISVFFFLNKELSRNVSCKYECRHPSPAPSKSHS